MVGKFKAGIIEKSESPWAALIIFCTNTRRNRTIVYRLCKLILVTIDGLLPKPRMNFVFDKFVDVMFMTTMGVTKGY